MSATREQMIQTAARLFQRDGYHATTWRGLIKEADTPWGSISHHFPGGKQELAIEAIRRGTTAVDALIDHCFNVYNDPADAVGEWFRRSSEVMVSTEYTTGCPAATVALEVVAQPGPLRDETQAAFSTWQTTLARHLADAGDPDPPNTALGILVLLEGGLVLARARHDPSPMRVAEEQARRLCQPERRD